jgi:cytochrome c556
MYRWLKEAEADAQELEDALRSSQQQGKTDDKILQAAFAACSRGCTECHGKYRDVPQK